MEHGKTFVASPLKLPTGTSARVRTALINIDGRLGSGHAEAILPAEQLVFWQTLAAWCAANITALETGQSAAAAQSEGAAGLRARG